MRLRTPTFVFVAHVFAHSSTIHKIYTSYKIFDIIYRIDHNKQIIGKIFFRFLKDFFNFLNDFPVRSGREALPLLFYAVVLKWSFVRVRYKK